MQLFFTVQLFRWFPTRQFFFCFFFCFTCFSAERRVFGLHKQLEKLIRYALSAILFNNVTRRILTLLAKKKVLCLSSPFESHIKVIATHYHLAVLHCITQFNFIIPVRQGENFIKVAAFFELSYKSEYLYVFCCFDYFHTVCVCKSRLTAKICVGACKANFSLK